MVSRVKPSHYVTIYMAAPLEELNEDKALAYFEGCKNRLYRDYLKAQRPQILEEGGAEKVDQFLKITKEIRNLEKASKRN